MSGFSVKVEAQIVDRDRGSCVRCGRHVEHLDRGTGYGWAIHHRRPRSAGGSSLLWVNQAANGIVLCEKCHREVESERTKAFNEGFLVSAIGVATAMTTRLKHALHGWVLLNTEGGYEPAEDYGQEWAQPAPSTRKDVT